MFLAEIMMFIACFSVISNSFSILINFATYLFSSNTNNFVKREFFLSY
ncbi:MAG: hypothetical protein ACI8YC_001553 [Salibacteraceae bacterium]|jgi:hypothetical protein